MSRSDSNAKYFDLTIVADSQATDIWLVDEDGHPVQKGSGTLRTSLLGGAYYVEFGLRSAPYLIQLSEASEYLQRDLAAGPTSDRPKLKFRSTP